MTGSKRVDHWTSGSVYEYSEFACSPQNQRFPKIFFKKCAEVVSNLAVNSQMSSWTCTGPIKDSLGMTLASECLQQQNNCFKVLPANFTTLES
jgi:hypothetical protein